MGRAYLQAGSRPQRPGPGTFPAYTLSLSPGCSHRTGSASRRSDLWPGRYDGYDLTDRILEGRRIKPLSTRAVRTVRGVLAPHPSTGKRRRGNQTG